jgi:large subunit ribosomal protein L14
MVIVGARIVAGDNSGARFLRVIKVLGSHYNKAANIGDKVVTSVLISTKKKKIREHDVCTGLLIRRRKFFNRAIGISISFKYNAVALVEKKRGGPIGTRIFGPYLYELRRKKYNKFLHIATTVI